MSEIEAAKREALRLLSRAETFRASLERKLKKKGFADDSVETALDELCRQKVLDDHRFAALWIKGRAHRMEGRKRLEAELCSRGVDEECANRALDEYFASVDEDQLCLKAWEKVFSQKHDALKTKTSLVYKGFSVKTILKAQKTFLSQHDTQDER